MIKPIPLLATTIIFLCSLIIIISPLRPQITSVTPELKTNQQWLTYKNDQYGFEFQYPIFEGVGPILHVEETTQSYAEIVNQYNSSKNPKPTSCAIDKSNNSQTCTMVYDLLSEKNINIQNNLIKYFTVTGGESDNSFIFLTRNGANFLIYLGFANDKIDNQILSTFKFIPDTSSWKTFKSKVFPFQINYPDSLRLSACQSKDDCFGLEAITKDKTSDDSNHFSIMFVPINQPIYKDLDSWTSEYVSKNYSKIFLNTEKITVNNYTANLVHLKPIISDQTVNESYFVLKNNLATEILVMGSFDSNTRVLINQILSTFRFTQ